MRPNILVINPADNVGVAVEDILSGSSVIFPDLHTLAAVNDIPYGHKVTLSDIAKGTEIVKYGHPIGRVNADLKKGEWVHLHNMIIFEED